MDAAHYWKKLESEPSVRLATDLIESAKRRCRLDDFGEGDF